MAFLFFSFWDRRLSRVEILWRRKKIGCVVDMGKDSVVKYCQDRCKSPEQRFVS